MSSDPVQPVPEEKDSIKTTVAGGSGDSESAQPEEIKSSENDPFGDESNNEVKYKVLRWWQASMIMIAETVSLGILSLPSVLAVLGFVPGMILILLLGVMATYTGFVIGQFKMKYPQVHNMADVGQILCGRWGRELLGLAQITFFVFVMGSHVLTFSIMMNTLTGHGACSILWGFVGMVVCLVLSLPRKLGDVSWMAIASFISIIASVLVTMIGVIVEQPEHIDRNAITQPSLHKAFLATTNIVFAYAGHIAFFSFISELKKPQDYPKALYLLQISDTTLYLIAAGVIYGFAGNGVASPALSSVSPMLAKIAYGLAAPTIVISGVINGHVAAKYAYVRMFRGTGVMSQNSFKAIGSWVFIVASLWTIAWLIAEAIPTFNDLLSLISSVFASWFTYGIAGIFWLFMNYGRYTENKKKIALTAVNIFFLCTAMIIMVMGLYASGTSIKADAGKSGGAFSCADNSDLKPHESATKRALG